MTTGAVRIGVVGAGGFGLMALQHFTQLPQVRFVAMAGTHREASFAAARRFGVPDIEDVDQLLARDDVDLVYIATPPFLHHPQALKALRAGKHVICEKPLAITVEQADELISVAREKRLLIIANLMQRYNPLFDIIKQVIESKVLGEFLHGYFENYASDEGLPRQHWFWDRSKSGGIFIEHGVHFFDMFSGWLGPGKVVAAQRVLRPESNIEEQVNCTARFHDGATVNFYHGFTQAARMDRQEFRLLFERGDVRLEEWVPVRAKIHALADEGQTRALMELFPGSRLDTPRIYAGKERATHARHKELDVYQTVQLSYGLDHDKMARYGELLRDMLRDQVRWIHDRNHVRKLTDENGRASLLMAVEAAKLAEKSA